MSGVVYWVSGMPTRDPRFRMASYRYSRQHGLTAYQALRVLQSCDRIAQACQRERARKAAVQLDFE